jgi:hypothetical protein
MGPASSIGAVEEGDTAEEAPIERDVSAEDRVFKGNWSFATEFHAGTEPRTGTGEAGTGVQSGRRVNAIEVDVVGEFDRVWARDIDAFVEELSNAEAATAEFQESAWILAKREEVVHVGSRRDRERVI